MTDVTDPTISAWVSANAGAGKTQMLAHRVTRLLLSGARPDRILCLTFTKAAAAEMSRRLVRDLGEWALLPDDELRTKLSAIGAGNVDAETLARARRLFAQALETPGGLKIQTIHSFCQLVLGRFPIEAGVPPRFQVLDERSADELMRQARNAVLLRTERDPELREMAAVIAARADDVRFGELIDVGIGTARGSVIDLVDAVGGDRAKFFARLRTQLGAPEGDERGLLNRFCSELSSERDTCKRVVAWLRTGGKTDAKYADLFDAFLACAEGAEGVRHLCKVFLTQSGELRKSFASKDLVKANPALHAFLQSLADRIATVEQQVRAVRVACVTEAIVTVALAVVEEYGRLKRSRAALDYDDLILKARDLVSKADVAAWVLYKLDGGIDHILVDEAQDTSADQWKIVQALAGEFFAGKGAHTGAPRTLFAVGDEKQSIFGFQGAVPAEFGRNRTIFSGLARQAGLPFEDAHPSVSRRSADKVLAFVDAVFAQPIANEGLTFESQKVVHSGVRNVAGRVEVWPSVPVPEDVDVDPWAPVDAKPKRGSHFLLAREVARRIRELLDTGARVPSTGDVVTPGSFLILVRRRNAFATEMIRQLLEQKIPVAGADRMVLMDQMAIQDLVALGRFALLPEDDLNLAALLKAPFLDLSEDDLFALAHTRESRLWAALAARKDERGKFASSYAFLSATLAAADTMPPFEFFARILGKGVRAQIVARLGDEAADAIDEFLALALAHEGAHAPSLQSFLDWFEKGASDLKRDMEAAGNAVRVMTVHGAKGLEAPIVIVPDTTQIPEQEVRAPLLYTRDCVFFNVAQALEVPAITAAKADAKARELEEYRRLLYVALTRARDWLIVAGYEMKKFTVHPKSWYQAAKTAAETMGAAVDEHGRLWLGDAVTTGATETIATATEEPLPGWARTPAPKEAEARRIVRPSDAAGEEEPALFSPLADDGKRFRRGLLIHALLAALPDAKADTRADAARNYLKREGINDAEAKGLIDETFRILDDAKFAPLFAEGSRAEIPIVAELPELGTGVRISGQIDRLAVTDDAVLIADYKTNRPPPKTAEDTPAIYRAQMALYRAALQKIYPAKCVSCALVWTDGARLMPLPDSMLDAELVQITQRMKDKAAA